MGREDIVAGRYARALAGLARERDCVEEVRRDLESLDEVLDPGGRDPDLPNFLNSPGTPPDGKEAAARRIMEGMGVGGTAADFVGTLIRRGRIGLFSRIARSFEEHAGELAGERVAVVRTARPLTGEQHEKLAAALAAAFGGAVRIRQRVEPGLLAGARVTIGDKVFDGTVLGRLKNLGDRLTAGGVAAWEGAVGDGDGALSPENP